MNKLINKPSIDSYERILNIVSDALLALGYLQSNHCRLSIESLAKNEDAQNLVKTKSSQCYPTFKSYKKQVLKNQSSNTLKKPVINNPIFNNSIFKNSAHKQNNDFLLLPSIASVEDIDYSQIYQGLSKATFNDKLVMIKWQFNYSGITQENGLAKEVAVLKNIYDIDNTASVFANDIGQAGMNELISNDSIIPLLASYKKKLSAKDKTYLFTAYTMPYFELGNVKAYLKNNSNNSLEVPDKLDLVLSMAQSLNELHNLGWCHGDIKPTNYLLNKLNINTRHNDANKLTIKKVTKRGNNLSTLLIDFANAIPFKQPNNRIQHQKLSSSQTYDRVKNNDIYQKVLSKGTPAYLAPECWNGVPIRTQADIYAFGVTMFEVLTGKKPFIDEFNKKQQQPINFSKDEYCKHNMQKIATAISDSNIDRTLKWREVHCHSPIPRLNREWQFLQPVINSLMAKNTEDRYHCMSEVVKQLSSSKLY